MEKFPNLRTLNTQKVDEEIRKSAQFVNREVPKIITPMIIVLREMEDRARKDYFRLAVKYELKMRFNKPIQSDESAEFHLESNSLHGVEGLEKLVQWSKETAAILGYDLKTQELLK